MTEASYLWTTGSSGDGTSTYTQVDTSNFMKVAAACAGFEGVAPNLLNMLAVTGASSPVAVNTGGAMVDGKPYYNSASVNVTVATPATSTRNDWIVLRADWSAHTVRITRIAGAEGGGLPAITQTSGTTYDIKLAYVTITTGGVITVTDQRTLATQFIARQGNSASNWQQAGTTLFPMENMKFCMGVANLASGNSSVDLTFPITYSIAPLVYVCPRAVTTAGGTTVTYANSNISTTGYRIATLNGQVNSSSDVGVPWFAFGPV